MNGEYLIMRWQFGHCSLASAKNGIMHYIHTSDLTKNASISKWIFIFKLITISSFLRVKIRTGIHLSHTFVHNLAYIWTGVALPPVSHNSAILVSKSDHALEFLVVVFGKPEHRSSLQLHQTSRKHIFWHISLNTMMCMVCHVLHPQQMHYLSMFGPL